MNSPTIELGSFLWGIALIVPRIAAAFLVLPLLSGANLPALVRNTFFVSLAIFAFPVAVNGQITAVGPAWPLVLLKELFIGVSLGFLFGAVFWAVSAAGNLIDSKIGSNAAATFDPIQGHETSLNGQFLSQVATLVFMASGGFRLFTQLLLTSYTIWPVGRMLPSLPEVGVQLISADFSELLTTTLMLASPALVLLSMLEFGLGLMNRYAPQLNVFQLTLSIKSWAATWIVLLSLGTFVAVMLRRLSQSGVVLDMLRGMLPAH